jgi:hypothetical protein
LRWSLVNLWFSNYSPPDLKLLSSQDYSLSHCAVPPICISLMRYLFASFVYSYVSCIWVLYH